MYGKHFESMYTGSMRGKGAVAFAVLGYIVAHVKPPSFELELNPEVIGFLIGEPEDRIAKALEDFCSPDPKSRTPDHDGRKLIKRGMYLYFVVNGEAYHKIRSDEDKRSYWREQKRKGKSKEGGEDDDEAKVGGNGSASHPEKHAAITPIYDAYPRKVGRPKALAAIERAVKQFGYEHVLEKTQAFALVRAGQDEQYTPNPETFFNQHRFNDDPSTWIDREQTNRKPLPKYGPHNPLPGSVPNNGF